MYIKGKKTSLPFSSHLQTNICHNEIKGNPFLGKMTVITK